MDRSTEDGAWHGKSLQSQGQILDTLLAPPASTAHAPLQSHSGPIIPPPSAPPSAQPSTLETTLETPLANNPLSRRDTTPSHQNTRPNNQPYTTSPNATPTTTYSTTPTTAATAPATTLPQPRDANLAFPEETDDEFDVRLLMPVQHGYYDPGERIPSYELSQEQHRRRQRPRPTEARPPRFAEQRTRPRDRPETSPARRSLKLLGLQFLNARQHFLLAASRDLSLVPSLMGLCQSWWVVAKGTRVPGALVLTGARLSEHFLTGVWCMVSAYLLYSVLEGLMVRWIVTYSTTGAIVRMLLMSAIMIVVERYLVATFLAEGYNYGLHTWIMISCVLTGLYIAQNFVTSNIDLKGQRRARFFDFYNIVVFAVVPVGVASFITMIGLLRSLLILRLDIDAQSLWPGR